MNEQCMSKVNHKISVLSVRARRPDGGEPRVKSYERKTREKKEGRILPSFLFSSSIFLPRSTTWTRQANQDMISFKDTTIINQLELTLPVPSLTW